MRNHIKRREEHKLLLMKQKIGFRFSNDVYEMRGYKVGWMNWSFEITKKNIKNIFEELF